MRLPRHARDVVAFSPWERLVYDATIAAARATGVWRYPVPASGDLETMRLFDKIYWVYKAQFPVARAARGSGLETFFASEARRSCELPASLRPSGARVVVSAAGDLMSHPFLARSGDRMLEAIADLLLGADVSMANLECVVAPDDRREFRIGLEDSAPLHYDLAQLRAATRCEGRRLTFLATANNHSLDADAAGVDSTRRYLAEEGIAQNGMNASVEEAQTGTILDRNGIRLGVIAHTFGLNAKKPPRDRPWIVNRTNVNDPARALDVEQIRKQIDHCRAEAVDVVILQLHWGMEHELYPRPEQVEVAHALAELGADVIIGHHPHVVQPMELYRTRRDPDRIVPIYYSLGNLITPFSQAAFCRSAVARFTLVAGTAGSGERRTYVADATSTAVEQTVDERRRALRVVPM